MYDQFQHDIKIFEWLSRGLHPTSMSPSRVVGIAKASKVDELRTSFGIFDLWRLYELMFRRNISPPSALGYILTAS
jgi:hypothetical protein